MQHGVVNLDLRVLYLKRHHVQDVVKFFFIRHQHAAVREPGVNITGGHRRPGVAPAVAVQVTIAVNQYRLARSVGYADQRLRALGLSVFVKADRRFDFAAGVDRLATDMTEQRVKRSA